MTSSRRAAALDAAWPPISSCAPRGSGRSRERLAHRGLGGAEIAARRRGVHHERGAQAVAAQHRRRERAIERDDLAERQRARAVRDRRCARAPRPSSGSRRGSAGARRSCARAAGSARPRGPATAISRSLADGRRRRARAARAGAARSSSAGSGSGPRGRRTRRRAPGAWRAARRRPRPTPRARADRRRARGSRSARGCRRDRRARPAAPGRTRSAPRARVVASSSRTSSITSLDRAAVAARDELDHDVAAVLHASRSPGRARCRCGA